LQKGDRKVQRIQSDPQRLRVFSTIKPKTESVEDALRNQVEADRKRALAETMADEWSDPTGARFELAEAQALDASAAAYLDTASHTTAPLKVGNGGEIVLRTQEAMAKVPGIIDTVHDTSADMLNAEASRNRLELAASAHALIIGVDAAQSIQARNSLEKMLVHQLAASHVLAMKFAARATDLLRRMELNPGHQMLSVEASRAAGTAARLMSTSQDGLATLERIRRGGKQTVKVVHVHQQVAVGRGGKAMVAGAVKTGGGRRRGKVGNGK